MKILRYGICGCFNEEEGKKTDHQIELRLNIFRRVPLKGTEHFGDRDKGALPYKEINYVVPLIFPYPVPSIKLCASVRMSILSCTDFGPSWDFRPLASLARFPFSLLDLLLEFCDCKIKWEHGPFKVVALIELKMELLFADLLSIAVHFVR
jgi:hypothetical protein